MKMFHIVLGAPLGAWLGVYLSWNLFMGKLVPWLALTTSWARLIELLLYVFTFFWVGLLAGAGLGVLVLIIITTVYELVLSMYRPLASRAQQTWNRFFSR